MTVVYVGGEKGKTCLGLDVSTKVGYVLLGVGDSPIHKGLLEAAKGKKGMPRAMEVAELVRELLLNTKPSFVVIEGYSLGSKFNLATMVEVGTLVRRELVLSGVPWAEASPSNLKKFATGSGAAKKEQVLLQVYKSWGFETSSNDVADAYALAKMGTCLWYPEELNKARKEAFDTFAKTFDKPK